MAASYAALSPRADHRTPQCLDVGEQRFAAVFRDDLAEHVPEDAHLIANGRGHLLARRIARAREVVDALTRCCHLSQP
jgi:hypothetical protein